MLKDKQLIEYYQKESKANLKNEYSHVQINNSFSEYQKYLEENAESKKSKISPILIKNGSKSSY